LHSEELPATHALIAEMLGVTRSVISRTAGEFRDSGLIEYERGGLIIINRAGLKDMTCECYLIIKATIEQLTSFEPRKHSSVVSHKYLYNPARGLYAAGHYVGYL
jgi:DNA-binding transcriptional regulator YhcF (GntR family)